MSKDSIGDRMKNNYEVRTQTHLPRRTNTIIRLDGKAFHSYTKGFPRPYDTVLMDDMDRTAVELVKSIQGAKMAYVQSDEISIVLTDYDKLETDAWFDGNVQKITSISASFATGHFNSIRRYSCDKLAFFDSRCFTIPELSEVHNYFLWRQLDATRNSIQMGAQSMFSHAELQNKNTSELQEMMFQKGTNWNDYPSGFKRGRVIVKREIKDSVDWCIEPAPIFTQNTEFIPNNILRPEEWYKLYLPQ